MAVFTPERIIRLRRVIRWIIRVRQIICLNVKTEMVLILDEYRKIPKTSPGAYIFKRPFLRGLFLELGAYIRRGLFTEGNLRFKIDWASLIVGSNYRFCFVLPCI